MANWIYKGKKYKTIPLPKRDISILSIVYVPKWDKCFELLTLGMHGNGSKEKACIRDVYTKKICWIEARRLELVIQID